MTLPFQYKEVAESPGYSNLSYPERVELAQKYFHLQEQGRKRYDYLPDEKKYELMNRFSDENVRASFGEAAMNVPSVVGAHLKAGQLALGSTGADALHKLIGHDVTGDFADRINESKKRADYAAQQQHYKSGLAGNVLQGLAGIGPDLATFMIPGLGAAKLAQGAGKIGKAVAHRAMRKGGQVLAPPAAARARLTRELPTLGAIQKKSIPQRFGEAALKDLPVFMGGGFATADRGDRVDAALHGIPHIPAFAAARLVPNRIPFGRQAATGGAFALPGMMQGNFGDDTLTQFLAGSILGHMGKRAEVNAYNKHLAQLEMMRRMAQRDQGLLAAPDIPPVYTSEAMTGSYPPKPHPQAAPDFRMWPPRETPSQTPSQTTPENWFGIQDPHSLMVERGRARPITPIGPSTIPVLRESRPEKVTRAEVKAQRSIGIPTGKPLVGGEPATPEDAIVPDSSNWGDSINTRRTQSRVENALDLKSTQEIPEKSITGPGASRLIKDIAQELGVEEPKISNKELGDLNNAGRVMSLLRHRLDQIDRDAILIERKRGEVKGHRASKRARGVGQEGGGAGESAFGTPEHGGGPLRTTRRHAGLEWLNRDELVELKDHRLRVIGLIKNLESRFLTVKGTNFLQNYELDTKIVEASKAKKASHDKRLEPLSEWLADTEISDGVERILRMPRDKSREGDIYTSEDVAPSIREARALAGREDAASRKKLHEIEVDLFGEVGVTREALGVEAKLNRALEKYDLGKESYFEIAGRLKNIRTKGIEPISVDSPVLMESEHYVSMGKDIPWSKMEGNVTELINDYEGRTGRRAAESSILGRLVKLAETGDHPQRLQRVKEKVDQTPRVDPTAQTPQGHAEKLESIRKRTRASRERVKEGTVARGIRSRQVFPTSQVTKNPTIDREAGRFLTEEARRKAERAAEKAAEKKRDDEVSDKSVPKKVVSIKKITKKKVVKKKAVKKKAVKKRVVRVSNKGKTRKPDPQELINTETLAKIDELTAKGASKKGVSVKAKTPSKKEIAPDNSIDSFYQSELMKPYKSIHEKLSADPNFAKTREFQAYGDVLKQLGKGSVREMTEAKSMSDIDNLKIKIEDKLGKLEDTISSADAKGKDSGERYDNNVDKHNNLQSFLDHLEGIEKIVESDVSRITRKSRIPKKATPKKKGKGGPVRTRWNKSEENIEESAKRGGREVKNLNKNIESDLENIQELVDVNILKRIDEIDAAKSKVNLSDTSWMTKGNIAKPDLVVFRKAIEGILKNPSDRKISSLNNKIKHKINNLVALSEKQSAGSKALEKTINKINDLEEFQKNANNYINRKVKGPTKGPAKSKRRRKNTITVSMNPFFMSADVFNKIVAGGRVIRDAFLRIVDRVISSKDHKRILSHTKKYDRTGSVYYGGIIRAGLSAGRPFKSWANAFYNYMARILGNDLFGSKSKVGGRVKRVITLPTDALDRAYDKFPEFKEKTMKGKLSQALKNWAKRNFELSEESNSITYQSNKPASKADLKKTAGILDRASLRRDLKTEEIKTSQAEALAHIEEVMKLNRETPLEIQSTLDSIMKDAATEPQFLVFNKADIMSKKTYDALYAHIENHQSVSGPWNTLSKYRALHDFTTLFRNASDYGFGQGRTGMVPSRSSLLALGDLLGHNTMTALLSKIPKGQSRDVLFGVASAAKTTKSAFDLSASTRQGWAFGITHPRLWTLAMKAQLASIRNPEIAKQIHFEAFHGEMSKIYKEAGLDLSTLSGFIGKGATAKERLKLQEEAVYGTRALGRAAELRGKTKLGKVLAVFPNIYGKGIRASERTYVTFLNAQRMKVFNMMHHKVKEYAIENNKSSDWVNGQSRILAKMINAGTGRSNVTSIEVGKFANTLFFSPRFWMSRFEYPFRLLQYSFGPKASGPMRRYAMRQIASNFGAYAILGSLVGLMANQIDLDFGKDPRSPNFLKVTMPDGTKVDFSAGFAKTIRLGARTIPGFLQIFPGFGHLDPIAIDSEGNRKLLKGQEAFFGEFARTVKSSFAPAPSAALLAVSQKKFGGQDADIKDFIATLTMPISFETFFEVLDMDYNNWNKWETVGETVKKLPLAMSATALDMTGINVSKYESRKKSGPGKLSPYEKLMRKTRAKLNPSLSVD